MTVKALPARYPQGAEKVLIQACTGRKVPAGGLPADVGCVVMNVTSAAVLSRYLKTGMPLVTKRITVDGSAVAHPQNIRVTIGTPIHEVLHFAGGLSAPVHKLLMGGPMMGLALMDDQLPVLKQNNAIQMCIRDRDGGGQRLVAVTDHLPDLHRVADGDDRLTRNAQVLGCLLYTSRCV